MADFPFQWVDILTEGTKITAWQQNADDGWFDLEIPFAFPWCAQGPAVLPRCTAVHPLHTRFATMFGAAISGAIARPNLSTSQPVPSP
jgi:hypothetical protein